MSADPTFSDVSFIVKADSSKRQTDETFHDESARNSFQRGCQPWHWARDVLLLHFIYRCELPDNLAVVTKQHYLAANIYEAQQLK